jgi:hypothetical protein
MIMGEEVAGRGDQDLEPVGIFKVTRFGNKQAYVAISKKILRRWAELGYDTRDLYVTVYMNKMGIVGLIPMTPDEIIEAKSWKIGQKEGKEKSSDQEELKEKDRSGKEALKEVIMTS